MKKKEITIDTERDVADVATAHHLNTKLTELKNVNIIKKALFKW